MLSIDFLAGFTIFLLALIVAAGMIPGMLAGLQSATIDYDGVAYRTSVILAEDPGWYEDASGNVGTAWEGKQNDEEIQRMGLTVSKDTPDVLSIEKIDAFFNNTRYDTAFYRSKVFFSDYPYAFNIRLKTLDGSINQTLGDPIPEGDHGYIRRTVMVKEVSSACLNFSNSTVFSAYTDSTTTPGPTSTFSMILNYTELTKDAPAYRIDPFESGDEIGITLDNLNKTCNTTPTNISLQSVKLKHGASTVPITLPNDHSILRVDGEKKSQTPVNVNKNITFILEPGFLSGIQYRDALTVVFTFKNTPGQNTNITGTLHYIPTNTNVTVPDLEPAVLEVAVW